jgi:hypothetical protein
MKCRTALSNDLPGLEQWTKIKFGKKDIGHYSEDILNTLREIGILQEGDNRVLDDRQFINVKKRRCCQFIGDVSYEICEIETSSPGDLNCNQQKWISVACEGDINGISKFLTSEHAYPLWACLKAYISIGNENLISDLSFPIFSGYPGWIRALMDESTKQFSLYASSLDKVLASLGIS